MAKDDPELLVLTSASEYSDYGWEPPELVLLVLGVVHARQAHHQLSPVPAQAKHLRGMNILHKAIKIQYGILNFTLKFPK